MDLTGKVVIITGSTQGIGKAIAFELAKLGAKIIVNGTSTAKGKHVVEEIKKSGGTAIFMRADVSIGKEVEKMVHRVAIKFGRIDILVNNAGISPKKRGGRRIKIKDIEEAEWERVMNINLKGVFNCSKTVMKIMIQQRSGKIINIASIAALMSGALAISGAHYAASKAGVICFTKSLAMELAQHGITANVIAPGRIDTEMNKRTSPELNESFKRRIPLGRFGDPQEIAKAVTFLTSDSANFITGGTLVIDGGVVMH